MKCICCFNPDKVIPFERPRGLCLWFSRMPLFSWGAPGRDINYRARLEQKMCIGKDSPEPTFDVSDCNLSEVPPGLFSMCRVFRKELLLLHQNQLTSLRGGGSLQDLSFLKVLNLHENKLSVLPSDIGCLQQLQVLNLADNRLKNLPDSMVGLSRLSELYLQGNKFATVPPVICKLQHLAVLDISRNRITALLKELCLVRTLQTLVLDSANVSFPPPEVCSEGTAAIMQFLCQEQQVDYIPPQQADVSTDGASSESSTPTFANAELPVGFLQYEQMKERRRQDLLDMEQALKESQESHAAAAADAHQRRMKLVEDVALEQDRLQDEISIIQLKKEEEKRRLLGALSHLEDHSAKLISELLALNDKSRNTEALLATLESDRKEAEELFAIKKDELSDLRRKEVLAAMQEMIANEERQRVLQEERQNLAMSSLTSSMENEQMIQNMLFSHEQDQQVLLNRLLQEEQYQKEAFQALQLQRDLRHRHISQQIELIESELTNLTGAELNRKDMQTSLQLNILAERRTMLAQLLAQLLEDKQMREMELKERIKEMEQRMATEMQDYWLLQYQRLMDRKPQELIDLELSMDPVVREILYAAGAEQLVTLFARSGITGRGLLSATESELIEIGVSSVEMRNAICETRDSYRHKLKMAEMRLNFSRDEDSPTKVLPAPEDVEPSAPSLEESPESDVELATPTAPPFTGSDTDVKLWKQTECIVCMDRESTAVFLPCGHVCCCWNCSGPLEMCPMCRSQIGKKLLLGS